MLIISSRDNKNYRWKRKATKNKDRKKQRSETNCSESLRAKGFCCAFKVLICSILFDMFLNPTFKMTTSFTNLARTTANTSKFIY